MCCVKCQAERQLTKHHILPRRWFGRNSQTIVLCRQCHNSIEDIINNAEYEKGRKRREKLRKETYYQITTDFVKGE